MEAPLKKCMLWLRGDCEGILGALPLSSKCQGHKAYWLRRTSLGFAKAFLTHSRRGSKAPSSDYYNVIQKMSTELPLCCVCVVTTVDGGRNHSSFVYLRSC